MRPGNQHPPCCSNSKRPPTDTEIDSCSCHDIRIGRLGTVVGVCFGAGEGGPEKPKAGSEGDVPRKGLWLPVWNADSWQGVDSMLNEMRAAQGIPIQLIGDGLKGFMNPPMSK